MHEVVILGVVAKLAHIFFAVILSFACGVVMGFRYAYRRIRSIVHFSILDVSLYALGGAVLLVAAALIISAFPDQEKPLLGDYTSPVEVLSTVEGVDGPAVKMHDELTLRITRCVNAGDLVSVLATRAFVNLADPRVIHYELILEPQARAPGCNTTDIRITLPEMVEPGRWLVAGEDTPTNGADGREWTSEPFEVVPNE